MLVFTNNKDKNKSVYVCDRCLTRIVPDKNKLYSIYVRSPEDKNSKKKWDLCERDYLLLLKGIENYSKKSRKSIDN